MNWSEFQTWVTHPIIQSTMIIALGYLGGLATDWFGIRILARMTAKTETEFDDRIIEACRPTVRTSVLLASMWFAVKFNNPLPEITFAMQGLISSWALLIWTRTLFQVSSLITQWLATIEDRFTAVTRRTKAKNRDMWPNKPGRSCMTIRTAVLRCSLTRARTDVSTGCRSFAS